jgi:hypothetical protein
MYPSQLEITSFSAWAMEMLAKSAKALPAANAGICLNFMMFRSLRGFLRDHAWGYFGAN